MRLYVETHMHLNWFLQLASLLLLLGRLDHCCVWAGLYFFMYLLHFSFTMTFLKGWWKYLHWFICSFIGICCRELIVAGGKVVHTMLWLLIFSLCCYGLEQYSSAGILLRCKELEFSCLAWKYICIHSISSNYGVFYFRGLDWVVLPSEASQAVKQRLLNFIRSLSTVLAFAYLLSWWVWCHGAS